MRDIAKLLFGDDAGRLLGLFGGNGGQDMAERARRAGEWCGTTPGRGSVARAVRGASRPHGPGGKIVTRDFPIR